MEEGRDVCFIMMKMRTPGPQIKEGEGEEQREVRRHERGGNKGFWVDERGIVRSLGVVLQLLALLLAISAVPKPWPTAPAVTAL